MKLKILQLNTEQGRMADNIVKFVKKQKFDILCLQEISSGNGGKYKQRNYFEMFKSELKMSGLLAKRYEHIKNPNSWMGNAILYKKSLKLFSTETIELKKFRSIDRKKTRSQDLPNSALSATFKISDNLLTIISAHLVWGPNPKDKKFKLLQNRKLVEYVKKLNNSFILTGDFNLTSESKITKALEKSATNLTSKYKITNTLNPNLHSARDILFPKGLAVDYIFVSQNLKYKNFKVIDVPDLSDHFGLSVEINI